MKVGVTHNLHYLDDFLFLVKAEGEECSKALSMAQKLFADLRVPIAPEKEKRAALSPRFSGYNSRLIRAGTAPPTGQAIATKVMVR